MSEEAVRQAAMQRAQKIMEHPRYRECVDKICRHERERKFCGHDMTHFLNVARIAMLMNLQQRQTPYRQDVIYAAALLHDIGRYLEYEEGCDHAQASADLAPPILKDCGYEPAEIERIAQAIGNHRNPDVRDRMDLNGLLYRADKASRPCYGCQMQPECNWKRKKQNMELWI